MPKRSYRFTAQGLKTLSKLSFFVSNPTLKVLGVALVLGFSANSFSVDGIAAVNGVATVKSQNNFANTVSKLKTVLEKKGMKIFATIPHSKGAASVGVTLNPTTLVVFGNPKAGAPLMACQQSIGIDLPQKALITEDDEGMVWLSYNKPSYLAERHNVEGCEKVLGKMEKALAMFASTATSAESE